MSELQISEHFVGSYPADSAEQAMRDMIGYGSDALQYLGDGETGRRKNWVVEQIDSYYGNDAFVVVKDGSWTNYEDCPEFGISPGHTLRPQDFNLRYHSDAVESWPVFDRLRHEYDRPDLAFQVGIPHSLDMSLFTFGLANGLDPELLDAYTKATVQQMERIREESFGDEVVFQIETPASMSMALFPQDQIPESLQPSGLSESIAELVNQAPEHSKFGIHLCLGDLGNESRGQLPDRTAAVTLINEIGNKAAWQSQKLEYVHEPHAAGKNPPILDKVSYQALANLRLPEGTRYIAGMVHESQSLDNQKQVLTWIKEALPESQTLGIATACGLGRRSLKLARFVGQRMYTLAHS